MTKRFRGQRGFTLVELMITVSIIGTLAATAITLFRAQQLRAKRAEAFTNVEAIAKHERGYYGENGIYTAAPPMPGPPLGVKRPWAGAPGFRAIGFQIDGGVLFDYDVYSAASGCACASRACFTATAYGDSDQDGRISVMAYFHPDDAGTTCPTQLAGYTPPIDPATGVVVLDRPAIIPAGPPAPGPYADDYSSSPQPRGLPRVFHRQRDAPGRPAGGVRRSGGPSALRIRCR
jgi:prepilin-type N-terminal cleavage/methylation domain-containing protein